MTGYIALVLLLLFVAAGVAAALDLTPDSRDPNFGMGPVLRKHEASDNVDGVARKVERNVQVTLPRAPRTVHPHRPVTFFRTKPAIHGG